MFVDTPGFQTRHDAALNRIAEPHRARARWPMSTSCCSWSRPAASARTTQKVLALLPEGKPVLLIANKLDTVTRRADLAPWLQAMQARHPFAEFVPLSATQGGRRRSGCSASSRPTCPSSRGSTTPTR